MYSMLDGLSKVMLQALWLLTLVIVLDAALASTAPRERAMALLSGWLWRIFHRENLPGQGKNRFHL